MNLYQFKLLVLEGDNNAVPTPRPHILSFIYRDTCIKGHLLDMLYIWSIVLS